MISKTNPINQSIQITAFAVLTLIALNSNASVAINRCTVNGAVIYTDAPCPIGAQSVLFESPIVQADNPAEAKKRHLENQRKLKKINQDNVKEENQHRRQARAMEREIKLAKAQEFKCSELKFKKEIATLDQATKPTQKNSKAKEKAQMRLRHASHSYEHHCIQQ